MMSGRRGQLRWPRSRPACAEFENRGQQSWPLLHHDGKAIRLCPMKQLLPLLLLLASSALLAESGAYRVEVIIFRNLAVVADANLVDELRSFSRFPALEEPDLPDDLKAIVEKTSFMDGIWRRLRSSKGYQPLLFAAWEQNRTDYYPPMRVHDEVVLDEQLHPLPGITLTDPASGDQPDVHVESFYRLDGTLQLRRSRFLHLSLDFEYRAEPKQADTQATFFSATDSANPAGNATSTNRSDSTNKGRDYDIYALRQSRQIRTGRLQYFDTPYFGALVIVSAIDAE